MKVKITYTVELEDTVEEVNRIFKETMRNLREIPEENLDFRVLDSDVTTAIERLDGIRRKLYKVDMLLGDMDGILKSYLQAKHSIGASVESPKELLNG